MTTPSTRPVTRPGALANGSGHDPVWFKPGSTPGRGVTRNQGDRMTDRYYKPELPTITVAVMIHRDSYGPGRDYTYSVGGDVAALEAFDNLVDVHCDWVTGVGRWTQ